MLDPTTILTHRVQAVYGSSPLCTSKNFLFQKNIDLSKFASVEFAQKANHGQNHRGHALRLGAMPGKNLLDLVNEQLQLISDFQIF